MKQVKPIKKHIHEWIVERHAGVLCRDIWICEFEGCLAKPRGKDYDHKLWWTKTNRVIKNMNQQIKFKKKKTDFKKIKYKTILKNKKLDEFNKEDNESHK